MITISAATIYEGARRAFLELRSDGKANSNDPELLQEAAAAIEISQVVQDVPAFAVRQNTFQYTRDYAAYFPFADSELVRLESEHYTGLLLADGQLDSITASLRSSPASRRNLLSTWHTGHEDASRPEAPCLTQLYFRVRNDYLDLHAHFRANNAWSLLLMDMELATSVQYEVASRLGLRAGAYVHFVDSLHLYKRDIENIDKQTEFFMQAPIWKQQ